MASGGTEQRGAGLARRELHFYWLLDTSGSMNDTDSKGCSKITALNEAIRAAADVVQQAAHHNHKGDLIVHAIQFDDGARWVSAELQTGVPGANFEWPNDLKATGLTDLGVALEMLADEIKRLPNNAFRPVICLVTDGAPSDNWEKGLKTLNKTGWGLTAWKVAIAIGEEANINVCKQFAGEIPVLRAKGIEQLRQYIRWLTKETSVVKGDQAPVVPGWITNDTKQEEPLRDGIGADGQGDVAPERDAATEASEDDSWIN